MLKLFTSKRINGDAAALPNIPELLQRIYASRITDIAQLERKASNLLDYRSLSGVENALTLLYVALVEHQKLPL